MPAASIPSVLIVLAYLLVPGTGICLATGVARMRGPVTFLALSLGCGFAAVASISFVLVLLGLLTLPAVAIIWTLTSAAAWVVALTTNAVGAHIRRWRRAIADDPWSTLAAVATIVGVGAVRWTYPPIANMGATAMRYWADALEIADAGRIPAETLQWGTLLRPATSKSVLNSFNAGISLLTGRGPLDSMGILLFIVSVSLVIVMIALLWALGLKRLAPLGALALFANQVTGSELTADLTRNLAENWGRLAALVGIILAIFALRRPSEDRAGAGDAADADPVRPSDLVIAGWVLGAAAGTHLVAAATGALFILAYAVGQMAIRGSPRATLSRTVGVGAVAFVVATLSLALPAGDLGFGGAGGDAAYQDLRAELGLSPTFDPTRFLVTSELEQPLDDETLGIDDVAMAFAYRAAGRNVQVVTPERVLPPWALIMPIALVFLIVVMVLVWGPNDARVTVLCASVFAAFLFLGGVAFALRYDLYALERFGNRRLFNYAMVPYVIVFLAGAEGVLRWIAARGRVQMRLVSIGACGLVVASMLVFLPSAGWPKVEKIDSLREQIALLRWIGEHVPCEGRVLADRRTLGTFQTMTGHAAVLEGMGPHVRPEVLTRAIGELFLATDFFEDPRAGRRYLKERGVAIVVATRPFADFAGWRRVGRLRPHPFRDIGFLRRVYTSPVGFVFRVKGSVPDPSLPAVEGRPGYRCTAG